MLWEWFVSVARCVEIAVGIDLCFDVCGNCGVYCKVNRVLVGFGVCIDTMCGFCCVYCICVGFAGILLSHLQTHSNTENFSLL